MNTYLSSSTLAGIAFITDVAAEKLKNVTVQEGDVLLNITGASIGRVTTVPGELTGPRVNQHVCIIRPTPALLSNFLASFLATPVEQMRINQCQVGATRQALTKQMIEDWQVPLPPLEDQQQIVAEIEKQFTRLEVGLAALRRVQANLKRYRAAVLRAACEGRLVPTEAEIARAEGRPFESGQQLLARIGNCSPSSGKTRRAGRLWGAGHVPQLTAKEIGTLPNGWAWTKVKDVGFDSETAVQVGPMSMKSSDFTDDGIPVLNVGCVQWGHFAESKLDHLPAAKASEFERYRITPGDVLFTRSGTVGRCAVAQPHQNGWLMTFHLLRARPNPQKCMPAFLRVVLEGAPHIRRQTREASVGSTRAGFNTNLLANLDIPLPPLAEQSRIVAEVERRLSVMEELEAVMTANLQRAIRLRGSILASSFRSERSAEQRPPKARATPALSQTVKPIIPKISSMKKQVKLTPEALVETVRLNKGRMTPSDLCLASNVEEEVEAFFEVLRECRDRGLLAVPSGIRAIIKLAKS